MAENKRDEVKKDGVWYRLSEKKKLLIVCAFVFLLVCIFVCFYMEFKRMNEITLIEASEYERLLNNLDGVKWKANKSAYSYLKDKGLFTSSDYCMTFTSDRSIIVEFENIWASFDFDTGLIKGYINHEPALMFFSQSLIKTGRALTLVLGGQRLIFYQES